MIKVVLKAFTTLKMKVDVILIVLAVHMEGHAEKV